MKIRTTHQPTTRDPDLEVSQYSIYMPPGWMTGRSAKTYPWTVSFILALCIGVSISPLLAGDERVAASEAKSAPAADFSDPVKTYRTYLEAIKWGDKDYDDLSPASFYSGDKEQEFRKVQGLWKIDFTPGKTGSEELAEFFKPGTWGRAFQDGMKMLNAVAEEIGAGKLKTWKQVTTELEKRDKVVEREWIKDHDDTIPETAMPSNQTKKKKSGMEK